MKSEDKNDQMYIRILKEELVPAMGCTEPIAIAYAAARARDILGRLPERAEIKVSRNILKNVKSVIVPNTNQLKGIEAAVAAGLVAGKAEKILEVIAEVSEEEKKEIQNYVKKHTITVAPSDSEAVFDILLTIAADKETVRLRIRDYHTHIVWVEKNGEVCFQEDGKKENTCLEEQGLADRSILNVKEILDFINRVEISDIEEMIERQIEYNSAIAEEGIRGNYGANIGSTLLKAFGNNISVRAKAMAAAGSDARMSGCEMPVIIVSGSGNQGMTASIPVIEYAKERKANKEQLIRSVALSDLLAIHLKSGIGRLSAYCGVVCAGCAAGAAIAYLCGGGYEEICHTLVNSLAIVSGIICDGAKASCAAKIAASVDAGILGYYMYQNGQEFHSGDGIVAKGVEANICNIGRLGKEGMKETDREIVKIMVGD